MLSGYLNSAESGQRRPTYVSVSLQGCNIYLQGCNLTGQILEGTEFWLHAFHQLQCRGFIAHWLQVPSVAARQQPKPGVIAVKHSTSTAASCRAHLTPPTKPAAKKNIPTTPAVSRLHHINTLCGTTRACTDAQHILHPCVSALSSKQKQRQSAGTSQRKECVTAQPPLRCGHSAAVYHVTDHLLQHHATTY